MAAISWRAEGKSAVAHLSATSIEAQTSRVQSATLACRSRVAGRPLGVVLVDRFARLRKIVRGWGDFFLEHSYELI